MKAGLILFLLAANQSAAIRPQAAPRLEHALPPSAVQPDSPEFSDRRRLLEDFLRARELAQSERFAESAAAHLELWRVVSEQRPGNVVLDRSEIFRQLRRAAESDPSAAEQVQRVRDEVAPTGPWWTTGSVRDWLDFNEILGDDHLSVKWFLEDCEGRLSNARLVALQFDFFDLFTRMTRWREAGLLLIDPVERASFYLEKSAQPPRAGMEPRSVDAIHAAMWERTALMYAALHAAARAEAADLDRLMILHDKGGRGLLIAARTLIKVEQSFDACERWIDEAEQRGAQVEQARRMLDQARICAALRDIRLPA